MNEYKYKPGDIVKFYDKATLQSILEQFRPDASLDYKRSVLLLHDRIVKIATQYNDSSKVSYTIDCSEPDLKGYDHWLYRAYMFEAYQELKSDETITPMFGMAYFK